MSFVDAIKTGFKKYVDFNGRARRSEYWFWTLFVFIVEIIVGTIVQLTGYTILTSICTLAFLLPNLAMAVRRLHDIGKKWTWILIGFIPVVGAILLIVWYCKDSEPGENAFGPNPKA